VMMIGLTPTQLSLIDASVLARWTVRPRLMAVPGVANVSTWGQRDQQLQVQVDPQRLAANDVTLLQVIQTTGNAMWVSPLSFLEASTPGTGGFIDTSNQRLGVQHVSPIVSPETLAQVTVEETPGRIVHLGDVATVVKDHQPLIGDAADDGRTALVLVVEKFPGANTLEVTRGVQEALAGLGPGLAGLDVDSALFRPATYIELAIGNVGTWLLIGSVLLVVALALLLFSWRAALVCIVSIVVSVAAATLVLGLTGATANVMVIAGLVVALGLVVDDAVVAVDRMVQRDEEREVHSNGRSWRTMLLDTSVELRSALLFATAITLLVVLPVLFLDSGRQALFRPLVLAYVLAVGASMVVALTLTPALSSLLLGGGRARRRGGAGPWLDAPYRRLLTPALQWPRVVVGVGAVLTIIGLVGLPFLAPALLPAVKDPNLLVQFDGPPGTSLPEMNRITAAATRELKTVGGVRTVGAHIGRAVLGDQVVNVNSAELWVTLDPAAGYDAAVAAVTKVVTGYPGIRSTVLTAEKRATSAILTDPGADVTVRLFGQDVEVLRAKAGEVATMLRGVDGIVDPLVEAQVSEPTMVLDVDLAAAERAGIKPGDVRRAAATLLAGTEVGSLFQDQKVFDVVVRGTAGTSDSVAAVENLLVDTPTGGHVRLGDVATVRVEPKPAVIEREDVSRRVDVTASVRGRSVAAVTADVRDRLTGITFPLENHAEVLGDHAAGQDTLLRVVAVVAIAALGIVLLLQGAFASWRLAGLVFLALPGAIAGGVVAVLVGGRVLDLGSLLGLVTVFAIGARGTVLMVRQCQYARDVGEEFGPELVGRAAHDRMAPTVVTALSLALAMVPLLFLGGVAGLEILSSMALTVVTGLVTSTALILAVVPALYAVFGSGRIERTGADLQLDRMGERHEHRIADSAAETGDGTSGVTGDSTERTTEITGGVR
jgi:Cu/Ag efflux pump CusA